MFPRRRLRSHCDLLVPTLVGPARRVGRIGSHWHAQRLLNVDDARPVDEQLVVLRRLVALNSNAVVSLAVAWTRQSSPFPLADV